jgi:hypothetical protein
VDRRQARRAAALRAAPAAALSLLGLAGCGHGGDGPDPTPAAPSALPTTLVRPSASVPTGLLPDLVGQGLQAAQDAATRAGFTEIHSHDALGRGRAQVVDKDWTVCFSAPRAGRVPLGAVVELAVVRFDETCPARDQGLPVSTTPPARMPDLRGRSLRVVKEALGLGTVVNATDRKAGRRVILPTSWQVCTQDPPAGTPFSGGPVTVTVVKFGETC